MSDEENNAITVEFEFHKQGTEKNTYREFYPGGVVGSFYLSRLASHFHWKSTPKRIRITIERLPD